MELIWYRVTLNADVSKSYQTVDSDPITFHPTFDMLIYIFDVDGAVKGTTQTLFWHFVYLIDINTLYDSRESSLLHGHDVMTKRYNVCIMFIGNLNAQYSQVLYMYR